jgi:hypothetical protein
VAFEQEAPAGALIRRFAADFNNSFGRSAAAALLAAAHPGRWLGLNPSLQPSNDDLFGWLRIERRL